MKKIFLFTLLYCFACNLANAECVATGTVYVACKPGYYLSSGNCIRCPSSGGVYGTTVDHNTGGITSCYIPSSTSISFSDSTGSGTYNFQSDCYYSE